MNNNIDKQIVDLRNELKKYNNYYYYKNYSIISDYKYDLLQQKLKKLEFKYNNHNKKSPTQIIGDDRIKYYKKFHHLYPMYSLENTFNIDEINKFNVKLEQKFNVKKIQYIVEPKIDGIAFNAIYLKNKLFKVLTRGNGIEGDDITKNAIALKLLPLLLQKNINFNPHILEIRGEIYINYNDFDILNNHRINNKMSKFSNPRHLVAGTMKIANINNLKYRNLRAMCYGINYCEPYILKDQEEMHETIKKFKLPYIPYKKLNIDEIITYIKSNNKNNFTYPIDGFVIKVNNCNLQKKIGFTQKAPKWAIAYKFSSLQKEAFLYNIKITLSRTGILTPIAEIQPTNISGTMIKSINLHNFNIIKHHYLNIGDTIIIEKIGDTIPSLVTNKNKAKNLNNNKYFQLNYCPYCKMDVLKIGHGNILKCNNVLCDYKLYKKILYFTSKNCMNIVSFNSSVIKKLVNQKICVDFSDIYTLSFNKLNKIFSEKVIHNLLSNINLSKKQPLWRLINGLSIEGISLKYSKKISQYFISLNEFYNFFINYKINISSIKNNLHPNVINNILLFLNIEHNKLMINNLIKFNVCCT